MIYAGCIPEFSGDLFKTGFAEPFGGAFLRRHEGSAPGHMFFGNVFPEASEFIEE